MSTPSAEERFWAYSLETYGRPGVAQAAIALQDRDGANVNLLLLCLWMAQVHGQALPSERISTLSQTIAPWSAQVTQPLRAVRRTLKAPPANLSAPAQDLREAVKALELDAERCEQRLLIQAMLPGLDQKPGPPVGPTRDLANASLATYAAYLPLDGEDGRKARLQDILNAVFV